ncbi:LLM class F420-dependent oxidoreductase [Spirillospora sp. CA-294931]|uniref:LLM class F420-dependent oxidoreductase n=1 Tax=Spirillospora sp. CA-294931 TaxID=3240042 RepID=UPI003D8D3ABE
MRLGYSLAYWGSAGLNLAEHRALVREAERLGYDSVWSAETYGTDPASLMAWLAGQTGRIALGTSVMQMPARRPVAAAMTAATIDQISGGRFRLGLGFSGPQLVEGWHGLPFERPLVHARDYINVVRMALAQEPISYEGPTLTLPLPDSQGKELTLAVAPVQERLPIYLGALGAESIRLAGELADGWLPFHFPAGHLADCTGLLREGAERAGRSLDGFDVAPMVMVLVDDDLETAYDMMRPMLALYLGGMGSRRMNFYNRLARRLGFEKEAETLQEAFLAGRQGEAISAIPDELVDLMTVCGPPARVRDRLAAYREAGATTLVVGVVPPTLRLRLEQLRLIAECAS